jgi:hypothetical protein
MYESFISEEKKFSKRFLELNGMSEDRFDEDEYSIVKILFKDTKKVDKIFRIIDDLVREKDFEWESRFVILGDFVFSMGSYGLNDPANLILKTSRDAYIKNIMDRAEINKEFGYDYYKYVNLHKKLLIGLRIMKLLKKSVIRVKGSDWVTIIYLRFDVGESIERCFPLGYCKFPFVISSDEKKCMGSFRNIWKLKRKKREMEDFPISTHGVKKNNSMCLELSSDLYNLNSDVIIKEKMNILNKFGCFNTDDFLFKLRSITEDYRYVRNIEKKCVLINEKSYMEQLKLKIKDEFEEILRYFQKIIPFIVLERKILDIRYYLPCFMDNRGRQYLATLLSPTFYKLFRYLYKLVEKREVRGLKESTYYKKISKYFYLISEYSLEEEKLYFLIVLFMEVGKHFIGNQGVHFIKTEYIIEVGIRNYKNQDKELKFDETLYVNKIKREISKILNGEEEDLNVLIFKDATASGLQNYGIIMGYREDKLKYLNIDGDDWCDTYQYLVEKFVKKESGYLERRYWKSTIMTVPYNAVWYSCFLKFIEKIREDGIEYRDLEKEEKEKLIKIHKEFYKNIKENVKIEFYSNNCSDLVDFKYTEWKVLEKKEYKVTYKKVRDKYQDLIYEVIEDKKSALRAREANNMHYLDAKLVNKVQEKFEILPIHDCFGIRLCEVHLVMDLINRYYSKIIKKYTYSIYIIK